MRFHDVYEKKSWLAEELTKELKETFQLPSVHVTVTVSSDEDGNADFSVMLCDLGNPNNQLPHAVLTHAKKKIQEWFENSQPNVRAVCVPAHYLPEAFVD